ncbi:MAG: twitch domain-containing radical SAM protein [Candidatus Fonsibacter sp.]
MNIPNTFCSLPWINLSTDVNGSLRPCCKFAQPDPENEYQLPNMKEGRLDVLWNDQRFQNLRQAFLDGKKPKECQSCWNEEAAGVSSFRLQFAKDKQIDTSQMEFNPIASSGPKALDLKLNNVCNLKCRICGPQASSTFLKEHQEQFNIKIEDGAYWISNKILGTTNEEVINAWSKELKHIEITGGEPMASPENIKILELIIKNDCAKDITLLLNTNGTLYNKKFIDLLTQFKSVTLCISIDDLEHRLEYERYPTEWNTILENIAKFKELASTHKNIWLTLCPTVSIFNVYYLPEYLTWAKSTGIWIYFNILHYNPCYSIKNLPPMLKEIVLTRITHKEFSEIRNFLNLDCEDDKLIYKFIENTKSFDSIRGQSFNDTFGIWGELITGYTNE